MILYSADCAIGYEAAEMVLKGVLGFRDDYISHIETLKCSMDRNISIPCVTLCPAGVDIPGYIALVGDGRYADAVRLIRKDNPFPNFENKDVLVIGGGNVAMDVARTALRCNAKSVSIAYRRRKEDMTCIEEALIEGCELYSLMSPIKIEVDDENKVKSLWLQPQIVGEIDESSRPRPRNSNEKAKKLSCEQVIVAIGQNIESEHFSEFGMPVRRGIIEALNSSEIENIPGIFAGGDCVTGPDTVIKAIGAGKVAAANIDEYLGYNHLISVDIELPNIKWEERKPCARSKKKAMQVQILW